MYGWKKFLKYWPSKTFCFVWILKASIILPLPIVVIPPVRTISKIMPSLKDADIYKSIIKIYFANKQVFLKAIEDFAELVHFA